MNSPADICEVLYEIGERLTSDLKDTVEITYEQESSNEQTQ